MDDMNYIMLELLKVRVDVTVCVCAHTLSGRVGLHRIGFFQTPKTSLLVGLKTKL